ncbi:OmpP1/FadL family transporter [Crenobacter intestini]|uniref:Transporter n=1 Tax=Crenobacter intestini TaxID=2563443 RepID=A0A4T0V6W4_9NEIS|nr:OmpP1/FadL family transporter [Crenobacter intestini]TIC86995.1 transporter [Crenobacter intestini]
MKLKHLSLSVMLIGATSTVFASGYHFGTQSVSSQSTANASAAEASDASTIFYNAAGMTKLEGTNFSGALNVVAPSVKYSNAKGTYPSGVAIKGSTDGKLTDDVVPVAHLYLTQQLNDKVTAGLGIYVPFASKTEYQRDSVLRYNLNETELKTIDINPTIAFKLNDQHSVAVGVVAQYAEAKLRQYANFGARVPALAGALGLTLPPLPPGMTTDGTADGYATVKGDDWGFGFNLAWLWDINDNARVGVNYRSAVKHTLEGNAQWTLPSNVVIGGKPVLTPTQAAQAQATLRKLGYAADESAKVDIKTPESLSLHGMYKFDPKWTGFADLTWTRHSQFDRAEIVYGNAKPGPGGLTPNTNKTILTPSWRNTYKVSLGGAYDYSEPLQLRAGIAYDKTPVPSEDKRLATMPDNDRIWFSFGGNYKLNKASSIDAAYSFIKIRDGSAKVNGYCGGSVPGQVNCVSSYTKGSADYKAYANILGVQYNYRF